MNWKIFARNYYVHPRISLQKLTDVRKSFQRVGVPVDLNQSPPEPTSEVFGLNEIIQSV